MIQIFAGARTKIVGLVMNVCNQRWRTTFYSIFSPLGCVRKFSQVQNKTLKREEKFGAKSLTLTIFFHPGFCPCPPDSRAPPLLLDQLKRAAGRASEPAPSGDTRLCATSDLLHFQIGIRFWFFFLGIKRFDAFLFLFIYFCCIQKANKNIGVVPQNRS